jgi:hypothetical protein
MGEGVESGWSWFRTFSSSSTLREDTDVQWLRRLLRFHQLRQVSASTHLMP